MSIDRHSGWPARRRGGGGEPRSGIRRELAWLVLAKLAALALLWYSFFTPAHRPQIDGTAASRRLGVESAGTDTREIPRD